MLRGRRRATGVALGTQQSVLGGCGSRLPVEEGWVGVGRSHSICNAMLRDGRSGGGRREFGGVTWTARGASV
jgi:hypothetical protein